MNPAAFRPASPALHSDPASPSFASPPSSFFRNLLSYVGIKQQPTINPIQHQGDMRTASRWSLFNTPKKDTLKTVLDNWVSQAEGADQDDRIKVVTALRIHCADQFNLPITTRNMIFESCANLTPEIIKAAKTNVRSTLAKSSNVEAFLHQWQPILQANREEAVKNLDYKSLKPVIMDNPEQLECLITRHSFSEIEKPVVLLATADQHDVKSQPMVDMGAVLRHWAENETHLLTTNKITLSDLQEPSSA